jgi:hypothetical protein
VDTLLSDGTPDYGMLLRWDVSAIPAGSTVESVKLSFYVTNPTTEVFEIYQLKRDWNEGQATWKAFNSGENWQMVGAQGSEDRGSTVLGTLTASAAGTRTVSLYKAGVAVVQSWVDNPDNNLGLTIQDYAHTSNAVGISSSEAAILGQRPRLFITYRPPGAAAASADSTAMSASDPTEAAMRESASTSWQPSEGQTSSTNTQHSADGQASSGAADRGATAANSGPAKERETPPSSPRQAKTKDGSFDSMESDLDAETDEEQ